MAMTERSRSAIYQGLSAIIEDEDAVGEMLSYFPARDAEEPASKGFVRAELALLRTELHAEMAALRVELHEDMAGLRVELSRGHEALKDQLHTDIQRVVVWVVGSMLTLTALVVAITGLSR